MLDLITKSKTRKKIILLLFYNPHKSYYLREIARLIGVSAGQARQELEKLKKSGVLLSEKRGNLVYFQVNTASPLYRDLKNVIDKTIGLKVILAEELKKLAGLDFAFLFGSYVKGDFGPESDIDLYLIGEVKEEEVHQAVKAAEQRIYRAVDYHLADQEEFREKLARTFFHQEILKNYILIIGDEDEFRQLISKTA
ncbi:MAG TPA: nucleotidyltransferase domain-containing protein [Candidatus Pacearchaeota archaeon]|nr:nucleotidyltransferase domain-containing protein [Candidatus Pacearchaeota archaeon]